MRNIIKLLLVVLTLSLAVCAFTFVGYAEDETVTAFSVYDKDGNLKETSGNTSKDLVAAAAASEDGDTIVLNCDLEVTSRIDFGSVEASPKTVNFDLAGYKLYTPKKVTPGLIAVGSYAEVNVYSSKPGGTIYCTCLSDAKLGGPVFNIYGNSGIINVGDFTDGDVSYPGSNLSTYSACLIDIVTDSDSVLRCDDKCRFNVNGGNYYSIHTDYSGYIIPRGGEIVMNITNANIISVETKAPINSAGSQTVLNLTNCCIIQFEANPIKLFNSALGTVNMKDCITTYRLAAGDASGVGVVHLEGRNVFAATATGDYDINLLANNENMQSVTTYSSFELTQGVSELYYYDTLCNFISPMTKEIPKLLYPTIFVPADDVVRYKFVKGSTKVSQNWSVNEKPEYPFDLPIGGEEGVYKYGWHKSTDSSGAIVYTVGYVADYNLKIRAVYENGELYFKLYAPAEIVDGGYIDFVNVSIQGEGYPKDFWEFEEIDGVKYCYAMTSNIAPEDAESPITVRIPCDYGKDVYVDTTWSFTLKNYIDTVLATEAEALWTEEQYNTVREIAELWLTKEEEDAEVTE